MPTPTYTPLATVTLGSSASSVTLSNIPASYRDLVLIGVPVDTANTSSQSLFVRFNSDSGSNYSFVYMGTDTSSTFASTATLSAVVAARYDNRQDGMGVCHIMDYSATDKHKTTLTLSGMGNRTTSGVTTIQCASRWTNTAAITSLFLFSEASGNFAAGSTFSLYGIAS